MKEVGVITHSQSLPDGSFHASVQPEPDEIRYVAKTYRTNIASVNRLLRSGIPLDQVPDLVEIREAYIRGISMQGGDLEGVSFGNLAQAYEILGGDIDRIRQLTELSYSQRQELEAKYPLKGILNKLFVANLEKLSEGALVVDETDIVDSKDEAFEADTSDPTEDPYLVDKRNLPNTHRYPNPKVGLPLDDHQIK